VKITTTSLSDCFLIEPDVHKDNRGIFFESFHKKKLEEKLKQSLVFVQDNLSVSKKGVLRGLHFQKGNHAQAKLVQVLKGEVLDVVVDLRPHSPTFRQHFRIKLSELKTQFLFIPKGMAHGFLALQDETIFAYKCDNYYNKDSESGIIYNDTDLAIDWDFPEEKIHLSSKDQRLPTLSTILP
jgi:dTDP-4-dehydrorhamnose 3,5-epimerase